MGTPTEKDELQLFKHMCQELPDPTLVINERGIIKEVSKELTNILEAEPDKLVGNPFEAFLHLFSKESQEKMRKAFQKHIKGEKFPPYTVKMRTEAGTTRFFELNSNRLKVEEELKGIVVTARDITERKKIREQLREYKDRLESAMISGELAWWEMNCKTGAVNFNHGKATMLGYPPNKFSHYTDFTELIHPKDYERTMQAMRDHLNGKKEKYNVTYRIRHRSGEYRWYNDVGGITKWDEEGEPLKVTGIVVNITARKKIQEKMNSLHAWAQKLNKTEEMEGIIEYTLNAIEKTLGFTYAAFFLKEGDFLQIKGNRGFESIPEKFQTLSLKGKGITVKSANMKKAMLVKDVREHPEYIPPSSKIRSELAVPIMIDDELIGVLDIESTQKNAFDTTDQKVLETLASHVAVAINGLREKKKRISLQRLDELRSQFIVMASHEFLTPLTTLKARLEMLQNGYYGKLTKEQEEKIKSLQKTSDHLVQMVEHFRQISKSRSKQLQLEKTKCKLTNLIEIALERYSNILKEEGIMIVKHFDSPLSVRCDKDKMTQVFWNLIENAIDYTKDRILIKGGKGGGTVWISITDNGTGIPEKDQEKIFEPFYRVEKDRYKGDREFYGGGLGLTVCKQIIEQHKGTLQVDSTTGKGSTFTITLPKHNKNNGL